MKTCSVCKTSKPLSEFYNYRTNRDGKSYRCKACDDLARRKWQEGNPERARRSARGRNIKNKYGLTLEEYAALLTKQHRQCAICSTTNPKSNGGNFCVDHDHVTGKVRGLLCAPCNRGIGLLKDDASVLTAAARYLRITSS